MGILFMLTFVIGMTILTFWGNGAESETDRAERIGAVPAGQMVALHAAVVRACSANMANCPPNSYINKYVSGPFLSPPYDMKSPAFVDGDYRFGSYFDGKMVYTYYTGIQDKGFTVKDRDVLIRGSVTAWLHKYMPPFSMGNVGTYDKANGKFVAHNYYAITRINGVETTATAANPESNVVLDSNIPDKAPLLRTRLKG